MAYLLLLVSYLVGAIPFSVVIGKTFKGLDVRDFGSGNPGTTNAFRVLGKKYGLIVFFLDTFKGGFVILLIRLGLFDNFNLFHPLFYGLMASIGHIFPVFIGFKGGKAVATSVGIFLVYAPILGLIGLSGYFVTLKLTRYVSVASCTGAFSLFVSSIVVYFIGPTGGALEHLFGLRDQWQMPLITVVGTSLIFYRHRSNFRKIRQGIEPKSQFLQKKIKT